MVVQHNLTAMNSNRMLGVTTSAQAKSTEKLSSGYKINRAADDAAGLSISEKMRKQIRGLTQASANAQDGISAVQTAEGALTEVHDMLQRMNELAVKAANGTNSADDRSYIQNEVDQLVTEIDRVAETTKFNETYLLKGNKTAAKEYTASYSTTDVAASATIAAGKTLLKADGSTYDEADLATALSQATPDKVYTTAPVKGVAEIDTKSWKTGDSIAAAGKTVTFDGGEDDLDKILAAFNGDAGFSADYVASKTETKLVITQKTAADATTTAMAGVVTAATVNGAPVTATGKTAGVTGVEAAQGTDYTFTPAGKPQLYDVDGNKISANALDSYFDLEGTTATIKDGKELYTDANGTTKLTDADVATYVTSAQNKTAALDLSLHVGADATDNNQITMKIETMSAKGIGVDGLKVDGSTDQNALSAIDTIKAAIQKVSTQRSALGAIQNRLDHTINNLDNVVENTTSAEASIRDTDMATEMVKYSNNNILAQAGQSMLAQANQSNQGVLSLLQ